MWIFTPLGYFSIVEKPGDRGKGTLTVRARARGDLEALRDAHLPELGPILESAGTDYKFRASAPRAAVAKALAALANALDYANFKDAVAARQGSKRAHLYHKVWDVLLALQSSESASRGKPVRTGSSAAKSSAIPKAQSYGGVLFDGEGRVLLREVAGHFGGYVWTFPKGEPDSGETPEQTALREVREETGYRARITGLIPVAFAGTTKTTALFLMEPVGEPGPFCNETSKVRWVPPAEAKVLIRETKHEKGRDRDLAILKAALKLKQGNA